MPSSGCQPGRAAGALGIPVDRITQILNGKRGISAATALRLARYLGGSAEFWMDLQSAYELRRARTDTGATIARTVTPRAA